MAYIGVSQFNYTLELRAKPQDMEAQPNIQQPDYLTQSVMLWDFPWVLG